MMDAQKGFDQTVLYGKDTDFSKSLPKLYSAIGQEKTEDKTDIALPARSASISFV